MKKLILAFAILAGALAGPLCAQQIMTYQGRLKVAGFPVTDVRAFSFHFCEDLSGGTCYPSSSNGMSFPVVNGLFKSTFTVPALDFSADDWYLQVTVDALALSPRERLTVLPYAVYASTAINFSGSLAGHVTGTQGNTVVGADSHVHTAATLSGVIYSTEAIVASTGVIQASLNSVIASTGALKTTIDSVVLSTGAINADLQAYKSGVDASTAAIILSTGVINADLQAYKAGVNASTAAIIISTGAIAADLAAEAANRGASDSAIGTATGTLRTDLAAVVLSTGAIDSDLQAYKAGVDASTAAIILSTGVIAADLASESASRGAADTAIATATGTLRTDLNAVVLSTGLLKLAIDQKLSSALPSANIYIGNGDDLAEAKLVSGDITISNSGAATLADGVVTSLHIVDGEISDDDISDTAGIAIMKLADTGTLGSNVVVSSIAVGAVTRPSLSKAGCAEGQLIKLVGGDWVCTADNNDTYTADGVSLSLQGNVFSAKASSVTLQGNHFNDADELVRLDGSGSLPAVNGSALLGLTPENIQAGILPADVKASSIAVNAVYTEALLDGAVTSAKLSSNIDVTKLGSGDISGTELDYLDLVTSDIQPQLNSKAVKAEVAVDTAALRTDLSFVVLSTGAIAAGLAAETASRLASDGAIGTATGTLRTDLAAVVLSTGAIDADLQAYKVGVDASTAAIILSTGVISADLAAETIARIAADSAIGLATGTLRVDLNQVILSTQALDLATHTNAGDTLVKRDGGGNLSAGIITAAGITSVGGLNLMSASNNTLYLDSGGSGNLNIGTGGAAKDIVLGNNTGATSLALKTGSGNLAINNDQIFVNRDAYRVGIGTAVPDQELTVAGDISLSGQLISSGTGTSYFAGNVGISSATAIYPLVVKSVQTYAVVIENNLTAASAVGLQATMGAPSGANTYALKGRTPRGTGSSYGVYGDATNDSAVSEGRAYGVYGAASNASNGYNYGIYGRLKGSLYGAGVYGVAQNEGDSDADVDGLYAGYFNGPVKVTDTFSVGGSTLVVDLGKVGIGTVSPDQTLTVNGNISQTGQLISSGTGANYFAGTVGISTVNAVAMLSVSPSGSSFMVPGGSTGYLIKAAGNLYDPGASPIVAYGVYSHPTASGVGSATVYSAAFLGGNVGIGTALPDSPLTVAGNISNSGVIVSSGIGASYFASSVTTNGYGIFNSTVIIQEGKLQYASASDSTNKVLKGGANGFVYWGTDDTAVAGMGTPGRVQMVSTEAAGAFANTPLFVSGSGKAIGLLNPAPAAPLDIISTATAADTFAQIWRRADGVVVASVSSQGRFSGDGTGLTGIVSEDSTKLPLAGGVMSGPLQTSTLTVAGNAFSVGGSTLVVMNGFTGLGLGSAPAQRLDVNGAIKIAGAVAPDDNTSAAFLDFDTTGMRIYTQGSNTSTLGTFKILQRTQNQSATNTPFEINNARNIIMVPDLGGVGIGQTSVGAKLDIKQGFDDYALKVSSNNGAAMFAINKIGQVGVGTDNPYADLHVQGAGGNTVIKMDGTSAGLVFNLGNGGQGALNFDKSGSTRAAVVFYESDRSLRVTLDGEVLAVKGSSLTVHGSPSEAIVMRIGDNGIVVSTGGAIQTAGMGHGSVDGIARGRGAVDLQTTRTAAGQVASGIYSGLGGGFGNRALGNYAVVPGGYMNSAGGLAAAVGGGDANYANSEYSAIAGGLRNNVSGSFAAIAGGVQNEASGNNAFVSGGSSNTAKGDYSWAGGYLSSSTANGAFTWADSEGLLVENSIADRTVFKNRGGFMVSTTTNLTTPAFYVAPSGYVGIGTASPWTNAVVYNPIGTAELALSGNGSNIRGRLKLGGMAYIEGGDIATNSYLAFYTKKMGSGEAERVRISSEGYVGINTSDPQAALDIVSTGTVANAQIWRDNTGVAVATMTAAGVLHANVDVSTVTAARLTVGGQPLEAGTVAVIAGGGNSGDHAVKFYSGTVLVGGIRKK